MSLSINKLHSGPPEVAEEEQDDMWYDAGDGILRELVECYRLTDGSVVYVKTSRFRMYDDNDVVED